VEVSGTGAAQMRVGVLLAPPGGSPIIYRKPPTEANAPSEGCLVRANLAATHRPHPRSPEAYSRGR
jgi:hypothetical protein